MPLKESVSNLLQQLQGVLHQLSNQQYTTPIGLFSNATIGQHTRHVIEFFIELNNGYDSGIVNYDQRERDKTVESGRQAAIDALYKVGKELYKPDKDLLLVAGEEVSLTMQTNYYRELVYNLEHMVHHMAILRASILYLSDIPLPENFGVAQSTIKFRKACAQ